QVVRLESGAPFRVERRREANDLVDRHVVVEILFFADEAGAPADRDARVGRRGVEPEDARGAGGGGRRAQERPDRRGLCGPAAPEKAVDGAGRHAEAQPAQRLDLRVRLAQLHRFDDEWIGHYAPPLLVAFASPASSASKSRRISSSASPRARSRSTADSTIV